MRKCHYEFWDPKTGIKTILTPKKSQKKLSGRFAHQVSRLQIGETLWLHTGEMVKCVQ